MSNLSLIIAGENKLEKIEISNFEELKTVLIANTNDYKKLIVDASFEAIKAAKADRAALNKLRDALKEKRKEIEKRLLCDFANQCKELESIVQEASDALDEQIKYFENAEKEQKKTKIADFYQKNIGDLIDIVSFDKVFKKEYLNKTKSLSDIERELKTLFERIRNELELINKLGTPQNIIIAVRDFYLRSFDFAGSLKEKTRLEDLQKHFAKKEEERKQRVTEFEKSKNLIEPLKTQELEHSTLPASFSDNGFGDEGNGGGTVPTESELVAPQTPNPKKRFAIVFYADDEEKQVINDFVKNVGFLNFLKTNNINFSIERE